MKNNKYNLFYFLLIIPALIVTSPETQGQEVFGFGGYQTNSDVTVADGELSFEDAPAYGFGFDVDVQRNLEAEFSWSMSASKAELNQYLGTTIELSDVYIHHFQLGALIYPGRNKKIKGYMLVSAGATLFHLSKEAYDDQLRFSIGLGAGLKVAVSDAIGLRFQARMLVPMQMTGGSVWFGTGGAGVAMGAWTAMVEGEFTGGISIRLD